MIDSKTTTLEVEVAGRDYRFHQSPGMLTSTRAEGTTGAVLWKIGPLVASWLVDARNALWHAGLITSNSSIVELGSGISGLIGCAVTPLVGQYIWTDQEYVLKTLRENITANIAGSAQEKHAVRKTSVKRGFTDYASRVMKLDWECDDVDVLSDLLQNTGGLDMIIVCDCIYNDFLINPLLETCKRISSTYAGKNKAVLLIAQQLRSDEIFTDFMDALLKDFRAWRIGDNHLPTTLAHRTGFAIHLAILKGD